MKLKNKKTGEIIELLAKPSFVKRNDDYLQSEVNTFNSLAELNAEWEDYEEPEGYWFVNASGGVDFIALEYEDPEDTESSKEIGNYFEAREEAEKAVEKLKAWKRLKDKGFRLNASVDTFFCVDIYIKGEPYEAMKDDLKIAFGGEE